MKSDLQFIFPIDQLANAIVEKLNSQLNAPKNEELVDEKLLTRIETSKKLNISLPTLHSYTKRGILKGYRVGVRVLYKYSEVESALSQIKYSHNF